MSQNYKFPSSFWWGAATSGPQSEGTFQKKHPNIFDYWCEKEPQAFYGQVGTEKTSDFYNCYKEDLAMLKGIGLNSFRTSIQWTRLIKDFETGEVDEDGYKFYKDMIGQIIENGMVPVINLHHFDLPIELYEKYGGWNSKHVIKLFVKYAKQCFDLFGDQVEHWITFNEPIVIVEGGYLYQFHYPKLVDSKKAVQVMFNLNLASAMVIEAFRKGGYEGQIGLVLNLMPAYPRSDSKEDLQAAEFAGDFFNHSFLEPAINGRFPESFVKTLERDGVLWEAYGNEMDIINKNTIDFLGVNYYQPKRVKSRETVFDQSKGWMPDKYFELYEPENRRMNIYRGWEIYPEAIYDIAIKIRDTYHNIPWFISENGMGVEGEGQFKGADGSIEDNYRIDFIKEHLAYLNKGMREGSNCFGYHMWTAVDCWSWTNAYKNRYGFISLDLETGKKQIKKSGKWMSQVIQDHGFKI